jgi:eukaryotic-like serine/threonine-protein kinase
VTDDPSANPPDAPEPASDALQMAGRLLDHRYHILEKIGEGGMSAVYLADDVETGEQVAVKVLVPELSADPVAMARLRREAEFGAKLEHPNICHIIRLGESSTGIVYVVMPLVRGDALRDRALQLGQLPLDITARFVRDIAAGLHLAHESGIVHRDLKAENIMIVADAEGSERAVVLDFGLAIARHLGPGSPKLTRTGMVVGTPDFMSPEQIRGKPVDRRSDIYSLAFMVYELLTGQLPVDGTTLREVAVARLKGELIPISTRRPDLNIPAAVDKVLSRALAVDPGERYATAMEFAEAFERAAGEPGPQRPRWWNRRR